MTFEQITIQSPAALLEFMHETGKQTCRSRFRKIGPISVALSARHRRVSKLRLSSIPLLELLLHLQNPSEWRQHLLRFVDDRRKDQPRYASSHVVSFRIRRNIPSRTLASTIPSTQPSSACGMDETLKHSTIGLDSTESMRDVVQLPNTPDRSYAHEESGIVASDCALRSAICARLDPVELFECWGLV
jgi:hypothetical protein